MGIEFKNVDACLSDYNFTDLSFDIYEKKITFICGRGKSSLLSLINGDILYDGEIINDFKNVFFLKQNFEDYFFCNTIYEEVLYNLKKRKIKCDYDKKIVNSLKMVGLDASFLTRSPLEISRGEKKKVALAIALACNFRLFILDEPFMNLDYASKKSLISLFRMMKLRYGKTFIIATNDTNSALELADEVIGLRDGKIIFRGNKFDLFTNHQLLRELNIAEPEIVRFTNLVKSSKGINLGYRDDINDLMKDIYRFVK